MNTNKVLYNINKHSRDKNIKFTEKYHKYNILTDMASNYKSVTTFVKEQFPKFDADNIIKNMMSSSKWKEGHKYWGMSPEEIKQSWNTTTNDGTNLHYQIECFMNIPYKSISNTQIEYKNKDLYEYYSNYQTNFTQSIEWNYFLNFIKDHPNLKPYRTEWVVYNEDIKIAGSIDMVFENEDKTLSIYDWKRTKEISSSNNFNKFAINSVISHIPDSNFWHYAIQLNIYKFILESKYDKIVKDLYLVRLHPENTENYELIDIPNLKNDIDNLFSQRLNQLYK